MNNKKNIIIIFIVSIVVLFFAFKDDFSEKIYYLLTFNVFYLLLGVLLVLLYWLLKARAIQHCIKKFDKNYPFKKAFKLILDTQFVNAVTPFSSGGQPYQIYKLKKQGIEYSRGTNIVIQDFIVYQIALIIITTIALIANNYVNLIPGTSVLRNLVIIGYLINLSVIVILFIVAFNKKGNKFFLNLAIKIGAFFKIIKDKENFLNKTDDIILNFHKSAKVLMKSKFHFVKIILLNLIALTVLYSVPFVLCKGLNIDVNLLLVIIASSYTMLIGSFVPMPGGSGGIEIAFIDFFGNLITGSKLSIVMIAWRFLTYYLGMLVGAITINIKEKNI